MKAIKVLFITAASVLSLNAGAQKIGHINSNDLMMAMPETKQMEETIKKYAEELEGNLTAMTTEYQRKMQEYKSQESSMTDLIKQDKISEIRGIEQRIQDFQTKAQEDLERKEEELRKPLVDKAKGAIEEVARENKFTYIIDDAYGILLFTEGGEDIMLLVKKKLGLQ